MPVLSESVRHFYVSRKKSNIAFMDFKASILAWRADDFEKITVSISNPYFYPSPFNP